MIRKIAALAAACAFALPARAIDGIAAELGRGEDHTNLLRIAVTDRWREVPRELGAGWSFAGYWEISTGVWDNSHESTADVAATPVFRFERSSFYVEGAIGFHLVQTHVSASRTFSTAFQFGDHIGAGLRSRHWDWSMRLQHLSNASIRRPNPGINFLLLRLQYDL